MEPKLPTATTNSSSTYSCIMFSYYGKPYFIARTLQFGSFPPIIIYACGICHQYIISKKDLIRHECLPRFARTCFYNSAKTMQCLLKLIAYNNYAYASITSPVFKEFVESFNRGFKIPSEDKLKKLMHEYAENIQTHILQKLQNRVVTLLIDGATKANRRFEGIILWTVERLYFYSLEELPDFKTQTIAGRLRNIIQFLRNNFINVVAICSDNASNNKALFSPSNPNNILDLDIFRIPCVAHVINLAISDLIENPIWSAFYKQIETVLKSFTKAPKLSSVRWCSLFYALEYLYKKVQINAIPAAIEEIVTRINMTYNLDSLNEISKIISNLMKKVEGDSVALSSVFPLFSQTISKLNGIEHPLAHHFSILLKNRFFNTEGMCLACLSYILTFPGYIYAKNLIDDDLKEHIIYSSTQAINMFSVAKHYDSETVTLAISGLRYYLENDIPFQTNVPSYIFWQHVREDINFPKNLRIFSYIAFELVQIPATEAPVERIFSRLSGVLTPLRRSTVTSKLNDLMIVKANVIFRSLAPNGNNIMSSLEEHITT